MPVTEWTSAAEPPGQEVPLLARGAAPGPRGRPTTYEYMPRAGRVILDPARLRRQRDLAMLTRAQLAQRARIHPESLAKYERGTASPMLKAFRRLFTALGCGPEDLLADEARYGTPKRHGRKYDDGADVMLDDDEDGRL